MKLKQCEVEAYDISGRVICLSGDIEENPGPSHEENTNSILKAHGASLANSVSLFGIRLSDSSLTAIDVGGGGDCFFAELFLTNFTAIPVIIFINVPLVFTI